MNLDPTTRAFLDGLKAKGGPPLHCRTYPAARQFLEDAQADPGEMAPAAIETHDVDDLALVIVRPLGVVSELPGLLYLHGGGWILGSWNTHQRLVRQLAAEIPAVVIFVDYTRSPEARFPQALEQAHGAARWVVEHAAQLGVDADRLAVMGDSVGGDLAAALTIKAKRRGGPIFARQVLCYPVTDACFETGSYRAFATGTNLTRDAMRWFWDAYLPNVNARRNPLAAPLQATREQLTGLPPALVLTAENDVLRDEGETYARRLADAGVDVTAVRYLGTVHDFMMLNGLARTPAARGAMGQVVAWLQAGLKREPRAVSVTFLPELEESWETGYF